MSKGSKMAQTTIVSGGAKGSYENKSQISYNDKQSGSYTRATATEKSTTGDFYWKNGTTGSRSEYKQSETVRVGDKSGYTEIYKEQRFRDVTYSNNHGGKSVVNYGNNHQGGAHESDGGVCSDGDDECEGDGDACSDGDDECEGDGDGDACSVESEECEGYGGGIESDVGGGTYESDECDYDSDSDYDSDY